MAVVELEADYLVVGAGAMGMAFTDALIDHADVTRGPGRPPAQRRRSLARRLPVRPAAPGLRLLRRGVDAARRRAAAAARPGGGPARAGDRRRSAPTTTGCSDRMLGVGQGRVLPELRVRRRPDGSSRASPASGSRCRGGAGSSTPATSPPTSRPRRRRRSASRRAPGWCRSTTWSRWTEAPSQYVVVGSGKTATDACIWLLDARRRPRRDLLGAAP